MEKIRISEGKLLCEKEARQVLDKISKLSDKERICFFYFYTKYGRYLFHTSLRNLDLKSEIFESEDSLERDYNLEYTSSTKKMILVIYKEFINAKQGSCANYFGAITVLLSYKFLTNRYKRLYKEANLLTKSSKINKNPIDIICKRKKLDFVECKFTISDIRVIKSEIDELRRIISKLGGGKEFLSTLDFKSKNLIKVELGDHIATDQIFNSEDILNIKIDNNA